VSRYRTSQGGRIDRSRPITFRFDDRTYQGFAGDTLASALLANGVHLVGRSFKYHRPRGILAAGCEEPNALVAIRRDSARYTPNVRATQVELYEGLDAVSQNRWPSLAFDFGALNGLIAPFIPAGFYYKTFMWPRRAWLALYEPLIRRSAGLGKAPTEPDPDRYSHRYAHCDVLVVGGGAAGLAAALAAADSGARVILCDEQAELGGALLAERSVLVDDQPAESWLAQAVASLSAHADVTVLTRTTAFGYFPHNLIGLCERVTDHLRAPPAHLPRERLWQVRAREVVLATGAIERPLVFPGNDRPGILLAGAARTYLNRYGVLPGTRAVVVTAGDSGYQAAIDLAQAGVAIAAVADLRAQATGPWPDAARRAGLPIQLASTVLGTLGRLRIRAVELGTASRSVTSGPTVACDTLLVSGGFTPSVHLFSQSRGKLAWDAQRQVFVPGRSAEHERSAGSCRGLWSLSEILADGARAGAEAAQAAGHSGAPRRYRVSALDGGHEGFVGALPQPAGTVPAKAFVDYQNDVTTGDLALAAREGFESVEHIKRYTTTGMATDQGKTSNLNALGVLAARFDKTIPDIGLTTFRMPYTPVTFGTLAGHSRGDLFDPVRTTPTHAWAAAHGAVFEDVGMWKRARYFPKPGEDMHAAVLRECRAVRSSCGIFDASTLGKIEVVGPDAVEFLNRLYINSWNSLAVARTRYGILLRDDGYVYDDGVVARTDIDRFHVTTTTGGAARVFAMMEDYLQTEWTDLKVWITSTTEQWAVIAVQGPRSRDVLSGLVEGVELAGSVPHMSVARGRICGIPMLLFRVSFSGEMGYEVNVPADYGQSVWEAVWAAGQAHGITAYGTESMHVLRAEKGYIIVGQDTDGTVTPEDVGLSWAIGKNKPDFVGKRSLTRPAMLSQDRKQLVGLLSEPGSVVLEEGAQIAGGPGRSPPLQLIGHVTSSYLSPTLGRGIALGLVKGGRGRIGQTLYVPMPSGEIPVRVVPPVFHDPEGARVHG
jgi:sarcosine oxidase, subunit alpha